MVVAEGDAPGKFHPRRRRAGSAETRRAPQGAGDFSALSLCHSTNWAPSPQAECKGNFFHAPAHRRADRVAGCRAYLGEGGFPLEVPRCSLCSATHRQTWINENKKSGGCLSGQFLSASLPLGPSRPTANSRSRRTPSMFIRRLFCIF